MFLNFFFVILVLSYYYYSETISLLFQPGMAFSTTPTTHKLYKTQSIILNNNNDKIIKQEDDENGNGPKSSASPQKKILVVVIPEDDWRAQAQSHQKRIRELLQPGLTDPNDVINSGHHRRQRRGREQQQQQQQQQHQSRNGSEELQRKNEFEDNNNKQQNYSDTTTTTNTATTTWTALDPKNPIFNFMIEYYGLKGSKGPRRLARWFPDPAIMMAIPNELKDDTTTATTTTTTTTTTATTNGRDNKNGCDKENTLNHSNLPTRIADGILLEGATEDDLASGQLHLRGARLYQCGDKENSTTGGGGGIVYSPSFYYFDNNDNDDDNNNNNNNENNNNIQTNNNKSSTTFWTSITDAMTPFLWYQSILKQTLRAEPVLHCYGLHEWAMQYYPYGAAPPPSARYQSHLPLRVSQQVINDTVERKGIRCTHVDALRYFAPAAGPYNRHGAQLQRLDQLRLEQPACVHAHMDLIKVILRLQPFCDVTLIQDALEIAIRGRTLDVAGSPYDASMEYGITPIPIETSAGRSEFQRQQMELMQAAEPVRRRILKAYDIFLQVAFLDEFLKKQNNENNNNENENGSIITIEDLMRKAQEHPAAERFAKAEPGGMPWRKNLI